MTSIDPMTRDPWVLDDREDEAIREQRWTEFRELTLTTAHRTGWRRVFSWLETAEMMPEQCHVESYGWHILQFAETEKTSGVLACLAQARRVWEAEMEKVGEIR